MELELHFRVRQFQNKDLSAKSVLANNSLKNNHYKLDLCVKGLVLWLFLQF